MANIFDRPTARPESVETVDSTDEEPLDVRAIAGPELNGSRDLDRDAASACPIWYTPRQVKAPVATISRNGFSTKPDHHLDGLRSMDELRPAIDRSGNWRTSGSRS